MNVTKIVGFDPASQRNMGWSLITVTEKNKKVKNFEVEGGTFVLPAFNERWQMLWPLFMLTDGFLDTHKPDLVVLEETSMFSGGTKFVRGQVSKSVGIVQAACGKHNIQVASVYPSSLKKAVAGHGRAKKAAVKKGTIALLKEINGKDIKFDSEHAYDACAAILCWLIQQGLIVNEESDE